MKRYFTISFLLTTWLMGCGSKPEKTTTPKLYTVTISQMQFRPSEIKVAKGDTVLFKNEDMVAHNVVESSSKKWSSAPLSTGQSWKLIANQSADYYCTIHPVMKGKIVVE
jgi:plastocyanin